MYYSEKSAWWSPGRHSTIIAGLVLSSFCWINLSMAAASSRVAAEEKCTVLSVSGASQPIVNGLYTLVSPSALHCSSHPVWTKTSLLPAAESSQQGRSPDFDLYVYYQEDGFDGWIISNTSCYTWGNFIASLRVDAVTPYNVSDTDVIWQESINGGSLTDSPRLTVTCHRFTHLTTQRPTTTSITATPTTSTVADKSDRRTVVTVSLSVVCISCLVLLVAAFLLIRRCHSKRREAAFKRAVMNGDSASFYRDKVDSYHDDNGRHDDGIFITSKHNSATDSLLRA